MKIILSGILSRTQYSRYAGPRETRLAFADGFRRLGHEVYFFEEVTAADCRDANGQVVPFERWEGRDIFLEALGSYGMQSNAALILDSGHSTFGMSWKSCRAVAREADLLLVVGGRFRSAEILDSVAHRAYLDINPAKTQAYAFDYGVDYGLDVFDSHFTVGLCVGTPGCPVPTGGLDWQPLMPPVFLDRWPRATGGGGAFTTVTTFGKKSQFEIDGRMSGDKVDQWLEFIDLPARIPDQSFQMALPLDRVKEKYVELLSVNGWGTVDARLMRTPDDYVSFVSGSRAEFSVANERYAKFGTGWFSDRTARYLAAGRPALVQSTGFEAQLPSGNGLLTFRNREEAIEGVERVNADYALHSRAAREFALEFLDSDKVLRDLLETTGLA